MADSDSDSDFLSELLRTNRELSDVRSGTHAEHQNWLRELIAARPPGSSAGSSSGSAHAPGGDGADAPSADYADAVAVAAPETMSSFVAETARGADAVSSDGSVSGDAEAEF